mmetsp:Transcript_7777/g.20327  ORF Transcript_7777/g.20327 Transcript_7777/m.20327 type:complete len:202 (-) Transcript_7777:694-1299(-)
MPASGTSIASMTSAVETSPVTVAVATGAASTSTTAPSVAARRAWRLDVGGVILTRVPSSEVDSTTSPNLRPKPCGLGCSSIAAELMLGPPAVAGSTPFLMSTVDSVVRTLFVIQYSPRPDGTLSENQPIMSGRNLRMACDCACAGSSLLGVRMDIETYCETTRATGSTRYAAVSCHPSGGLMPFQAYPKSALPKSQPRPSL